MSVQQDKVSCVEGGIPCQEAGRQSQDAVPAMGRGRRQETPGIGMGRRVERHTENRHVPTRLFFPEECPCLSSTTSEMPRGRRTARSGAPDDALFTGGLEGRRAAVVAAVCYDVAGTQYATPQRGSSSVVGSIPSSRYRKTKEEGHKNILDIVQVNRFWLR